MSVVLPQGKAERGQGSAFGCLALVRERQGTEPSQDTSSGIHGYQWDPWVSSVGSVGFHGSHGIHGIYGLHVLPCGFLSIFLSGFPSGSCWNLQQMPVDSPTDTHGFPRIPTESHGEPRIPTESHGFPHGEPRRAMDSFIRMTWCWWQHTLFTRLFVMTQC
ncbi:hypothetical protein K435DRAFT_845324 [Dendrothele bispora CBS 962.96]|uniref:Uncharacterized protein n=1 Tax=Dendrothele bispora (strain CBS 962.96) TaxID=1314807 RepID=A0A4S8KV78_DENBC|nr:hypothetical protein K435DRAFT_845324 [Dendrothele bispora CBS 962.96]